MSRYRRVLVPVDFSACSERLVRKAADLAEPHGAELILLHAIELPPGLNLSARMVGADGEQAPVREHLQREAEERMAPLMGVASERGATASYRIVHGPAAATVLRQAEQLPADVIVVGSHGRTGVQRLILGSVSEAILRHAAVPVVTVRSEHHPGCEARTCATCQSGVLDAKLQAEAELDG
jgi:universal stress protein A